MGSVFLLRLQSAFTDRGRVHGHRPDKLATIMARGVSKQSDAEVSLAISREAGARDVSIIESLKCRPRFRARPPIALALRCGGLLALLALTGCEPGILPSQGVVGKGDTTIMIDSLAIMLAIVVPTIVATLAFAWWFRSSNSRARHQPDFIYSGQIELVTWSIPLMTIMLLGGVAWLGSHELDPAQPLPSDEAPLNVQAVSLDWKWLFIYPDHNIATVNRLVIPVGAPVHFTLTSASVMNTFFVPKLGSMIYTMNRMATQLYLNADQPEPFQRRRLRGYGVQRRGVAEGRVLCLDRRDPKRRRRDAYLANLPGSREAEHEGRSVRLLGGRAGFVSEGRYAGAASRSWAGRRNQSGRIQAGGEITYWANSAGPPFRSISRSRWWLAASHSASWAASRSMSC
jgi:cytochrome o ubiquinol oxidase subunit II